MSWDHKWARAATEVLGRPGRSVAKAQGRRMGLGRTGRSRVQVPGRERRGPGGDGPGGRGRELGVRARNGPGLILRTREVRKTVRFLWIEWRPSKKIGSRPVSPDPNVNLCGSSG